MYLLNNLCIKYILPTQVINIYDGDDIAADLLHIGTPSGLSWVSRNHLSDVLLETRHCLTKPCSL